MGATCSSENDVDEKWYMDENGPGVEYGVHSHGFWGNIIPDGKGPFKTYELNMEGQEEAFGDTWQANYDEDHKKIFADNLEGKTIRAGMELEHAMLYRHSCIRTTTNTLDGSLDFLQLLNFGKRGGRSRVFTYAMMDDGWYFAETGSSRLQDTLSKHAVHANGRFAVRYSGTFRIIQNPDTDEYALVPDNDSGTYRPNQDQLPALQACINANFPKLKVLPLSALKPQPEELKSWYGPDEVKTNEDCVYEGKWVWANNDEEK